jgi:hypothetical protein
VPAKLSVAAGRWPKRSAIQPEAETPITDSMPALPKAPAACSGVKPMSTR